MSELTTAAGFLGPEARNGADKGGVGTTGTPNLSSQKNCFCNNCFSRDSGPVARNCRLRRPVMAQRALNRSNPFRNAGN
jgi:hypothetical protein